MEESDDPWVRLKFQGCHEVVRFKASDDADAVFLEEVKEIYNEIEIIADAVHQAFNEARKPF